MRLSKRLLALALGTVLAVSIAGCEEDVNILPGVIPDNALLHKDTLYLWYTDEALEDYISSMALKYSEQNDVRVIPVLQSGLDYLEEIYDASVLEESAPDLYITSNDMLEKAYLSGLADPLPDQSDVTEENYPKAALDAVTYKGEKIAYPLYYETSALVYNKTYLQQSAQENAAQEAAALAAEQDAAQQGAEVSADQTNTDGQADASGQDVSENGVSENGASVTEETILAQIPASIEDILSFADHFNAPEQVEAVFKWDVSDIFYNYFFAGNYMNVGGDCGDDSTQIDIYNLDAIKGLTAYQELNQFFSIDPDEVNYDMVVEKLLEGKLVFTVGTTDILAKIREVRATGECPYEFGVTTLPDVNQEVKTRSLSVTNAVVVNGYSEKTEMAHDFAAFLTGSNVTELYASTGRMPARANIDIGDPNAAGFNQEYAASVPIPKLMNMSNFWMQTEIAYTKIWSGEDASTVWKELSEQIMTQVTGEQYEEEYIEPPVETQMQVDEGEME